MIDAMSSFGVDAIADAATIASGAAINPLEQLVAADEIARMGKGFRSDFKAAIE